MASFTESQDEIPNLLKSSDKTSKNYENSYRTKLHEVFNLFFFYFSKTDLITFPIKYVFYLIELFQILSFAFYPQVHVSLLFKKHI